MSDFKLCCSALEFLFKDNLNKYTAKTTTHAIQCCTKIKQVCFWPMDAQQAHKRKNVHKCEQTFAQASVTSKFHTEVKLDAVEFLRE